MALSDTKLRSLTAKNRTWQVADGNGLFIEILPSGRKVWRLRYRFQQRQEKATLGEYPAFSLAEARLWREKCRSLIAHGVSPAQKKQEEKAKQKEPTTGEAFSKPWLTDIIEKTTRQPRNVVRVINKDIIPVIGHMHLPPPKRPPTLPVALEGWASITQVWPVRCLEGRGNVGYWETIVYVYKTSMPWEYEKGNTDALRLFFPVPQANKLQGKTGSTLTVNIMKLL